MNNLPLLQKYNLNDKEILVVRDDLSFPFPNANNSKVRGITKKLLSLRESGVRTVASVDTSISRIGWGTSYIAKELDMVHYNFFAERSHINFYQQMSNKLGGTLVPIKGTYSNAMRSLAQKWLECENIKAYLFPTGASIIESVIENSIIYSQLLNELPEIKHGSIVISVSSGTIAAGVYSGILDNDGKGKLYGVMSSSFKNRKDKILKLVRKYFTEKGELSHFASDGSNLNLVDLNYKYKDKESLAPPFPCDLYLDRKAWKFLLQNLHTLEEPIVFWNIGGEWDPERGLTKGLRGDGISNKFQVERFLR